MGLLDFIQGNFKIMHKSGSMPTEKSKEGFHFVSMKDRKAIAVVSKGIVHTLWDTENYNTKSETDLVLNDHRKSIDALKSETDLVLNDHTKSIDALASNKAEKSQVQALINGINKLPAVDTYKDTSNGKTSLLSKYRNPKHGDDVLVKKDETKGGISNRYCWNNDLRQWVDMETGTYDDIVDTLTQTNIFGKSATFGLVDIVKINTVKNAIRDIYLPNVNSNRIVLHTFGSYSKNFYFALADMAGKGDDDASTSDDLITDTLHASMPQSGILQHPLKKNNIEIGYVEIDWDLYHTTSPTIQSSTPTTYNNAHAVINQFAKQNAIPTQVSQLLNNANYSSQTNVFGSAISFGLADTEAVHVLKNCIRSINIDPSSGISTNKLALRVFGRSITTHPKFFVHIADMTGKGDSDLITDSEVVIETSERLDDVPKTGVHYINLIKKGSNEIVGSIEVDMDLYFANPVYLQGSIPKTYKQAAISYKKYARSSLNILPKCVVKYDLTNIEVFQQSKIDSSLYYGHKITHLTDNSDAKYLDMWRLTAGNVYRYIAGQFVSLNIPLITDGENEFTTKFSSNNYAGFYTGGFHGGERIDTVGSYVQFLIDGIPLTTDQLAVAFTKECSEFKYRQLSTIHKNMGAGATPEEKHPIRAKHLKETTFKDCTINVYNQLRMILADTISIYHAGLYCVTSNAGKYAALSDGRIVEYQATENEIQSVSSNGLISYWNVDNNISFDITSNIISGISEVLYPKVWDTAQYLKYYNRLENMDKAVDAGYIIESNMIITHK